MISAYFLYALCMMDSLLVQHLLGLVISSMVQGRARLIIHFLITNLHRLYSSVIKYNCSNIRCKMTNYAWCCYNIKAAVLFLVHFICCVYSWSSVKVNGFKRRTPISVLIQQHIQKLFCMPYPHTFISKNVLLLVHCRTKRHFFLLQQYFFMSSWSHKESIFLFKWTTKQTTEYQCI